MSAFVGTGDSDTLTGTTGNDTITGLGANDRLAGTGGNDEIFGDAGNDLLFGGTGDDLLDGGGDNDRVEAGSGNDTIIADGGDRVLGESGDDLFVVSGSGNVVSGGGGTDTITFGTSGTYSITPGTGGFTVTGPGSTTTTVSGMEFIAGPGGDTVFGSGEFIVCFASGTRIMTSVGEVAVERLRAGDLVATLAGRGSPMKPVLWVGRRRVVLAGYPQAEAIAPIRIRAGALGANVPHCDLLVSPDHCLFLDGALVPARLLVDRRGITVERGLAEVTYYHVELAAHDVLLAEGAAAESWLDCANRSWFENAPVARLSVDGTLEAAGTGHDAARACAPLVHGGERLAAIRAAIARNATMPDCEKQAA